MKNDSDDGGDDDDDYTMERIAHYVSYGARLSLTRSRLIRTIIMRLKARNS